MIPLLAAIAIPNFIKARQTAQMHACINNLRMIDAAKQQWALEKEKKGGDVAMRNELQRFLPGGQFPSCPAGGAYKINTVDEKPTCSVPGHQVPNQ